MKWYKDNGKSRPLKQSGKTLIASTVHLNRVEHLEENRSYQYTEWLGVEMILCVTNTQQQLHRTLGNLTCSQPFLCGNLIDDTLYLWLVYDGLYTFRGETGCHCTTNAIKAHSKIVNSVSYVFMLHNVLHFALLPWAALLLLHRQHWSAAPVCTKHKIFIK